MRSEVPLAVVESDEVVLYVEVRCLACFDPKLFRTAGERPFGRITAGGLYKRQRRYRELHFECSRCAYQAAELVNVTEAVIHVTTPQRDPHPALARPRLFLCEPAP